ncbi:MAG: cytochrome c family protein [Saprospiraceae bacterium]|nr:cytochrome c family protein [Candidatus Vicinibacter affinis]
MSLKDHIKPGILKLIWLAGMVFHVFNAYGQISPGKLSKAHSHLEGMSQCTQCHTLGDKVSDQKCLDCHTALKKSVQSNKGYHVSYEVKPKNCISCHSEHHGLKFEMIRFDQKSFNHRLTGYELEGAHKSKDCRECHKPEFIQNAELKKNAKTFLGLDSKCLTCHADYHQKTLSLDCAKCHNFDKFKPAVKFNHQKTDYPLLGAHQKLDCASCHKKEIRNGKDFQKFSELEFKSCVACHKDEHKGRFGANCKACHTEESFHKIKTSASFNHTLTGFALEGKHKVIYCRKCHDNRAGTIGHFREFASLRKPECLDCHKDVHEGKFGSDCKKCHHQESFHINRKLDQFDHDLTKFPLAGKHQSVDCKKCHKAGSMTDPVAFDACKRCHDDYHKGEFSSDAKYHDCGSCHSVNGFGESSFGFEQHQESAFPLSGAHLAVECKSCHQKSERWTFRQIGNQCKDCHKDPHAGILDAKYYLPNQCASCHNDENWSKVNFDHGKTTFVLEGKHELTSCRKCHFIQEKDGAVTQKFKIKDKECFHCHNNPHGQQFEQGGITDCSRCHGFIGWDGKNFNHDNARFKLDGQHKVVSCNRCHEPMIVDGRKVINYRNDKLECKDCHLK